MNCKRIGKYTVEFETPPSIIGYASVGSKKEAEGPLSEFFDIIEVDTSFGQSSWEKAESEMQKVVLDKAIFKGKVKKSQISFIFAGDLINQCTVSSFAHRSDDIPYIGIYGACSNMAESLILSAMTIDGGYSNCSVAITSSHFCSAERQYRFPLEYGGQRPQTSQWTVTGSGAIILGNHNHEKPYIAYATTGKIVDWGIKDANNMGAAMAPAAYDTLSNFFVDTSTKPSDYDLIVTGDLGKIGANLLKKLFEKDQVDLTENYTDCGKMIFDDTQDAHAGGSGCGCSASVLCSYILKNMENRTYKNVIFAATGALLSTTSSLQGETIPAICHLVNIKID
ncbi:MAG: stage V sporulation protein AD [Clostridia bacterium]